MELFPVTRVIAGEDGVSYFKDDSIAMERGGDIGFLSTDVPTESVLFRVNAPDYDYDWHTAPTRQFIAMLTGEIEIEAGSGEKRRFRPGDVAFVEDTTGAGHTTRNVGGTWRRSLFIKVDGPVPFTGQPAE